jgi:hypothetical protein
MDRRALLSASAALAVAGPPGCGPARRGLKTVIPILQKRGLFQTQYGGRTLREHLHD